MSKKSKNKKKKPNLKKLKYAKFHKDKPGTTDLTMPELPDDLQKQKRDDEEKYGKFFKFNRNPRPKEIVKRREVSKRD